MKGIYKTNNPKDRKIEKEEVIVGIIASYQSTMLDFYVAPQIYNLVKSD